MCGVYVPGFLSLTDEMILSCLPQPTTYVYNPRPRFRCRRANTMCSHFNAKTIKKILQSEVDRGHRDNARVSEAIAAATNAAHVASTGSGNRFAPGVGIVGTGNYYNSQAYRAGRVDRETGAPVISEEMAIVVSGLAKLYVGELVDTATEVMRNR